MKQLVLYIGICQLAIAQNIEIKNDKIYRVVVISHDSIKSTTLSVTGLSHNVLKINSKEFSFLWNDKPITGATGWKLISQNTIDKGDKGKELTLKLASTKERLEVELTYALYPNFPVIRKWISVKNTGTADAKLESLNVEDLETEFWSTHSLVYRNYARYKQLGTFVGDWDDAVVVIQRLDKKVSMAIGNESPGVLKRTAFNTHENNIEAGLTHTSQDFPFRKWIKAGQTWKSPAVFMALTLGSNHGEDILNNEVNDFAHKHLAIKIYETPNKPVFVYNTWYPFRTFVNDTLIRSVAKAASECGVQEFVIDDGWQINEGNNFVEKAWGASYGDWLVHPRKFKGGLKPTFDYIKSLGMRPGLWISIGSVLEESKAYKTHPEWVVKNYKGQNGNLHFVSDSSDFYTTCFGTDWDVYIKDKILGLVKDYGLAYTKLDLSIVTSAYVNDTRISGCYSTEHPYHKDHQESFWVIYEKTFKLFDDLHREAPDLFIDCTFETAGKMHLMDYAIAQHADGNWLSNFEEASPTGPLRVRQMAWWRSPAMPASSLVIGNQQMEDPDQDLVFKSLIGTFPILLGDPRKLTASQKETYKTWSLTLQRLQKAHNYMNYRQDLAGFGEPQEGAWDGLQRINTDTKSGGIVGVFRQGAKESKRQVYVSGLELYKSYVVKIAPNGETVGNFNGIQLSTTGFEVDMKKEYDGKIFEISSEK
ncbi:MAG: alpha-galactosidase [Bacteroidota bacterium]|nr:alpha-galactosidase [Bacteroidota bacterium]